MNTAALCAQMWLMLGVALYAFARTRTAVLACAVSFVIGIASMFMNGGRL